MKGKIMNVGVHYAVLLASLSLAMLFIGSLRSSVPMVLGGILGASWVLFAPSDLDVGAWKFWAASSAIALVHIATILALDFLYKKVSDKEEALT